MITVMMMIMMMTIDTYVRKTQFDREKTLEVRMGILDDMKTTFANLPAAPNIP